MNKKVCHIKRKSSLLILISIFFSILILGACGSASESGTQSFPSDSSSSSKSQKDTSDVIEITFWSQREELYADYIAEFEKLHPHIKVNAQHVGSNYDEMAQRVMAAAVADNLPHVVQMGQRHGIAQVADSGRLVPIEKFMSEEEMNDVLPAFWERFTYKGSKWTIPFESSTPVLYYNKTRFDEKGLQPPRTWDELVEVAKQLTDHEAGIWGFNTAEDIPWYVQPMVWNRGGKIIDAEGNVTIKTPQFVDTLQSFHDLYHLHKVMPPNQLASSSEDFVQGRLAMMFRSGASLRSIKEQVGDAFEVGVAFLPAVDSRNVPIGGNSLGIFKSDEKTERAAWEFVKFMTSAEKTAQRSIETGYIPIRQSAYELDFFVEHLEKDPDFKVAIDQTAYLKGQSINPADGVIWLGIAEVMEKLAADPNSDPEQLAEELEQEVQEFLAQYNP